MRLVLGAFQGYTHLGLQLLSPNEIRVDLTGDLPSLNDSWILNLAPVPEPRSFALLAVGLLGLIAVCRRRELGH